MNATPYELPFEARDPWGRDALPDLHHVEQVLSAIQAHVRGEQDSLNAYRRLAGDLSNPVIALLMQMIVEDEERHHALLERTAASLRDLLTREHSMEALPAVDHRSFDAPPPTVAALDSYLQEEETGARQLRRLADQMVGQRNPLPRLLLEIMALDSDKHAHILRFLHEQLSSNRPAP